MSARQGEQPADEPGDNPGGGAPNGSGAEVVRLPLGDALPAAPARSPTLGERLRLAREAAGLTQGDVADRTKIRPGLLTLIETDEHDRLPALTYTLGFIKAYARTVGLDAQEAAEQFRREAGKVDAPPSLIDLQPLEERRLPSRALVVATLGATLVAVVVLAALSFRPAPEVLSADATAPSAPAVVEGPTAPAAGAPPMAAPAAAPIALVAVQDVWIRISDKDNGERFFEGTLAAGNKLDIPPGRALVLRAGRAGALQVLIGNETLPPLGGPAEVLRAQSLDAAALRAATAPRAGLSDNPAPLPG